MPVWNPKTKLLPFDTPADAQSVVRFFFSWPHVGDVGGAIGGCIVVAVEREIKFAPQTRFSPAISRYRKHGRLTNSQLRFRTTARFKPAQIKRARERSCDLIQRGEIGTK